MPTPLELLLDPVSLGALGLYALLMLWEALRPGRALPRVRGWVLRGLGVFAVYFLLSSYLPLWWDAHLAPYRLFDLTGLGTVGGGLVAVLVYELLVYGWHRTMHARPLLWRWFHQMHHSAERIDTYGAFYFSPLDMIGWTFIGSFTLTVLVGVSAQAATLFLLATLFLGIFQHANIATPRWLGYLVQRPESHSVHHARGVHLYNYSDLPVFDLLFGTFRNPREFAPAAGFYDGASARIPEMLIGRDVSDPPTPTQWRAEAA